MINKYKSAGVDTSLISTLKEQIKSLANPTLDKKVISGVGGFGGVIKAPEDSDTLLVASTDGVGTKTQISSKLNCNRLLGHDVVNHCVNDILPAGATPLFFLDYIGMSEPLQQILHEVISGIAEACSEHSIALIGGETAIMPGYYPNGLYDIVGFIVGTTTKSCLLNPQRNIRHGDLIYALPSSGLHTNGYSLVRKVLQLDNSDELLYATLSGSSDTVGEALVKAHRCYLTEFKKVQHITKGIAHITGGSFKENIPRILPKVTCAKIDVSCWKPPPIFNFIQDKGDISREEMYDVFNMGVGMTFFIRPENSDQFKSSLPESFYIGKVEDKSDDDRNVILYNI